MSGGTFDERDPCAKRGSFDLGGGEPAVGASPRAGSDGDDRCAGLGPGVRTFPEWWPGRFHSCIRSCTEYIVDRIGERNVRAVILSGSFAINEGSVLFTESGPLFLSDIDLLVVLDSREAHARSYRDRSELGEACEALFPGAVFSGRFDVGIFLTDELRRLPSRPGVFDLREYGVVLWGDGDVLSLMPEYRESRIGGQEALVLLENRMLSLLGGYPGTDAAVGAVAPSFLYGIARAYTDIATAALCLAGSYRAGYDARARLIDENADGEPIDHLVPRSLVPLITQWTRFKLEPSVESRHGRNNRAAPDVLWEEAAGAVLDTWKRGVLYLMKSRKRAGHLPRAETLFSLRGGSGGVLDRLRFWRMYLSRVPPAERIRIVASMWRTIPRIDPLEAIRYDGMRLIEHRPRGGADGAVPRLAVVVTYPGGDWEAAAARAHRMWAGIVFGGKDV